MATDSVQVNSKVGIDGNSYTSSISNDQLTNDDFLKLMIQELKLQDPTKPMDSKEMLSTQMQMSTISTNQELMKAMTSLQASFAQTNLSNAASVIGKNIEDGNVGSTGINKAYTVRSVENTTDGVQVKAQEMLYMEDKVILKNGTTSSVVNYNVNGEILDDAGAKTGYKIALSNPGEPLVKNGKLVLLNSANEEVASHNYELAGVTSAVYSDKLTSIPFSNITKIF